MSWREFSLQSLIAAKESLMVCVEEKVRLLRDYFLNKPNVLMAFVFGSYAKGRETSESDIDIAVYFRPAGRNVEWEERRDYEDEDRIWSDVEKITGINTDLVVLNTASSTLAWSVIREGIPIVIKDRCCYLKFFLTVSSAAEYFREFTREFWAIKQRSLSLMEADRDRLIRVLDFLETELADHPAFDGIDQHSYETESTLRRNVERWTENIVNASIDIAKILLASEKQRMPQTYRETLEELSLLEGFSRETSERLAGFAKLRNILAHEYLDIRYTQIKRFVKDAEPLYRELLDFAKGFVAYPDPCDSSEG